MLNKNIFEMLKYRHLQKNKNAFTLQNFLPTEISKKFGVGEKKNLGGFTLIEVLTAIFLIVVGVIAALSLILQTISYTNLSSSKLVASYLVQEGIEIVRNIRDTNWLEEEDWKTGLGDDDWEADYTSQNLTDIYDGDFLKINGGFYNYTSGADTKFTRKITIVSDTDGAAPRLKVSVEVEWQQLGKKQIVKAQEYLYNWR